VVVSIINSAVLNDELRSDVQALPSEHHHFLIADECHRYAGGEFSRVFKARYESSLGLSATPHSFNHNEGSADPVTAALGSVFFRYTYKEGLADGVIQPFTIHYIGVDLTPAERQEYDLFTKRIRRSLKKIRQRYGPRLEAMKGSFYARLHTILNTDETADSSIRRYFEAVRERKALVYAARNRKAAYLDIMTMRTLGYGDEVEEDRIIVFDERIENVQEMVAPMDRRSGSADAVDKNLEALFFNPSFKPVMYHSARPSRVWNDLSMRLFRAGKANVMLSVKSLVEGVDVPAANVGVIRASSSSVRQRIQTTGRILRRAAGKEGTDLYIIYVRATTDERIFRDAAWSDQVSTSAINSIHWIPPEDEEGVRGDWLETELPIVDEWSDDDTPDFDVADLNPGDLYPGKYAGVEYHVDSRGRPFKKSRRGRIPITNPAILEAAGIILRLKKGGKFVVSPEGHIVAPIEGDLIFLGLFAGEVDLDTSAEGRTIGTGDRAPTFEELFGRF
jgi:superfamily II DNA or RNA helicase